MVPLFSPTRDINGDTYDAALVGTPEGDALGKTRNTHLGINPPDAIWELWHAIATTVRSTIIAMLVLVAVDTGCVDALQTFSIDSGHYMTYNFGRHGTGTARGNIKYGNKN